MNPSDTLIEMFLGLTEAVAAYGDHLDTVEGERLAEAARELVDRFWDEAGDYPSGAREHRDEFFGMLMTTQPAPARH
ncbi:hypothetical protein ACIB24_00690 [Spongisporangium articulatum]|uniref:Uncharacterized protein n=1 Tax=Spongisporangium articulatum TaxID=3362603 RepID=A0ABW8AIX0_9ACTN